MYVMSCGPRGREAGVAVPRRLAAGREFFPLAALSHPREAPKAGLWGEGKPGPCPEEVCSVLSLQAHCPPPNLTSRRER